MQPEGQITLDCNHRPNADFNLRPECRVYPKLNVETDNYITATSSFIYVATALLPNTVAASTSKYML